MHQEKSKLKNFPIAKWYNFAYLFRWFFFITVCFSTFGWPKTGYVLFWVFDLVMLAFSVVCLKSFMNISGILIIVEEFCLFLWHFLAFIFWEETSNYYKEGTVKFWITIMFILYLLVMLIEIALIVFGGKLWFTSKQNS